MPSLGDLWGIGLLSGPGHASAPEVTSDMKKRVVDYWTDIHKDLGQGVAQSLGIA
ncbi:hypothetical protein [Microtetraspora sp. NBRC 16547]|uniref:hypothetical protein n=1 Tax=Microtetraspora sp. NBRC 16547 TaxID=3030993 RepID=UPI0024A11900|nr:hypothetical protein [Microtetraspora sp. NBRC 16547]GLW98349.1 hypothetical protein Misp02_24360 [Microtetraspora sp. NBRC 16547]